MKPPIETIRLSTKSKDHLTQVKRKTGIDNWNILCRWSLCLSLRETTNIDTISIVDEKGGGVEMVWKVFAGDNSDVLSAVIMHAYEASNCSVDISRFVVQHLSQGIKLLSEVVEVSGLGGLLPK